MLKEVAKKLLTRSPLRTQLLKFNAHPVSVQELEVQLLFFFFSPQRERTAAFANLFFILIIPERMLGECETDFKLLLAKRSCNWALGNLKFFPLTLSASWPFLCSALRTLYYLLVTHNKLIFSSSMDSFFKKENWVHFKANQVIYCHIIYINYLLFLSTGKLQVWELIWCWWWFNKYILQMYFSKWEALQLLSTTICLKNASIYNLIFPLKE